MHARSHGSIYRCAAVALAIAAGGCGSESPTVEPASSVDQPIFGGQNATTCQWPTTVLLNGCSGTLVHPQIVTTAAHCGTNHRTATFGESMTSVGRTVPIDFCRTNGNGAAAATDYAFCKLAMPVTDVPIVPILMGCEV